MEILTQWPLSIRLVEYGPEEEKVRLFLERFPEYQRTLRLALSHEESGDSETNYKGWQYTDVEVHPAKLVRLVTEGLSQMNVRTRHATYYLLRDRSAVKKALNPQF
jgi:hypothetical protein